MRPGEKLHEHFSRIAPIYRELRTTDLEPVLFIRDRLGAREAIRMVDVGCGAGRYDLRLFETIENLELTLVDTNSDMLAEACEILRLHGFTRFQSIRSSIAGLRLESGAFDAVCSFNAIHFFDVPVFLARTASALRREGAAFIYTRTPEQNADSIWGRYFPRFLEKETRLYQQATMERWLREADSLELREIRRFTYPRRTSLDQLVRHARARHYSTFALYDQAELEHAINGFARRLRSKFTDLDRIVWEDGNIMYHAVRTAP